MDERADQPPGKRPLLVGGASLLLSLLFALTLGASFLAGRSASILAEGLEGSAGRVEAAFSPGVEEALRAAVRTELSLQANWLRSLPTLDLPPERFRAAATPAERLTDFLADGTLDPAECRSFLEHSRRSRAQPR